MNRRFVSFFFPIASCALLVGCGSSGNNATSNDSGAPVVDGSVSDAFAGDGATADAEDAADAGPNCLVQGTTESACRACCENGFNAGYQIFAAETLACACQPALCGPPDGGSVEAGASDAGDAAVGDGGDAGVSDAAMEASDDAGAAGDGSPFGQSVCTASCNRTAAPDPTCNTCILDTLGSLTQEGPCATTVLSQCLNDATCSAYFGCVENCPFN
ncbi:MAG: hypothetical protein ACLQVI_40345 [Polyangiaceae bacterium]